MCPGQPNPDSLQLRPHAIRIVTVVRGVTCSSHCHNLPDRAPRLVASSPRTGGTCLGASSPSHVEVLAASGDDSAMVFGAPGAPAGPCRNQRAMTVIRVGSPGVTRRSGWCAATPPHRILTT